MLELDLVLHLVAVDVVVVVVVIVVVVILVVLVHVVAVHAAAATAAVRSVEGVVRRRRLLRPLLHHLLHNVLWLLRRRAGEELVAGDDAAVARLHLHAPGAASSSFAVRAVCTAGAVAVLGRRHGLWRRRRRCLRDRRGDCHRRLRVLRRREGRCGGGGGGGGGSLSDWTTSVLIFGIWAGLMYYIFQLAPNQTPYRDTYFLQKLCNLKGDDGFRMNDVLVPLWYIMGLWPLVYSMLLLPTGRSSKSKIPVWPFLILSCIGGAYALIPYFVLWKPPPPPIDEEEIGQWPLKFLESKLTAGVTFAVGLGLIVYAAKAGGEDWQEFIRYFRESKLIHITCLDFCLLSAFSPFWVYNDLTARRWKNGSWLLPLALIPFVGPSLYLLLRPSLSSLLAATGPSDDKTQ